MTQETIYIYDYHYKQDQLLYYNQFHLLFEKA
jgi:hypothetical protein